MKSIQKELSVNVSQVMAFQVFVHLLNKWWPREYTWSQEQLQEIKIDARKNGLCTEIGPHGFRCDWGQVIEISEPNQIVLAWQISPQRIPEPNPDKSSEIEIELKICFT